jgi:hypothetical protein
VRSLYFERDVPRALAVKALRRVWPGIVWSPISPVRFARLDPPPLPGADWVRVENRQCGICATDLSLVFVKADPGTSPVAVPRESRLYLGHEAVGRLVEVGAAVQRLQSGDRVVMGPRPFGRTFRQHPPVCRMRPGQPYCANAGEAARWAWAAGGAAYTAHESQVESCGAERRSATLVGPAIAVHAVLRRRPQPGERVLVVGRDHRRWCSRRCGRSTSAGVWWRATSPRPPRMEAEEDLGPAAYANGADGAKRFRAVDAACCWGRGRDAAASLDRQ